MNTYDILTNAANTAQQLVDDIRNLRNYGQQGNIAIMQPLSDTCQMKLDVVQELLKDAFTQMNVRTFKVITVR